MCRKIKFPCRNCELVHTVAFGEKGTLDIGDCDNAGGKTGEHGQTSSELTGIGKCQGVVPVQVVAHPAAVAVMKGGLHGATGIRLRGFGVSAHYLYPGP